MLTLPVENTELIIDYCFCWSKYKDQKDNNLWQESL